MCLLGVVAGAVGIATGCGGGSASIDATPGDVAHGDAASDTPHDSASTDALATPSFATKVDFPTGSNPVSIAVGDLNGDGVLDLAVTNQDSATVSVFLNATTPGATTPQFAAKVDFATGMSPHSVAVADVNGDGKLDLAVANFGSSTVSVFLNTSALGATTPSFAAKVDLPTGSFPVFVATGDLNGDGVLDLAVTDQGSNTVSVFLNTTALGATTPGFAARAAFPTGSSPGSVAVADLNGDGKPDLAAPNLGSNTVSVILNTTAPGATTPSFSAKVDFPADYESLSVAAGDLDGDATPDLAIANDNGALNTASVLLNATAAGASVPSFAPEVEFPTGTGPICIKIGDFNGDGKSDLVVANGQSTSVSVLIKTTASGATAPTFAAKVDFPTGDQPQSIALGDVNGDGKADFAVANGGSNTVSVLLAE